ncbi:MAG: hypothetical protein Q8M92_05125 [Candidatus Subteraquimicrobiales bacterium]|nr:hypothetical protein [Candidatus Subteraquimicrobiales bacterium]
MMTFQERSEEFQQKLENLQREYGVQLYATQVLLQNGEIAILIKLRDLLPQEQVVTKKYENFTKKGNPSYKETQKSTN